MSKQKNKGEANGDTGKLPTHEVSEGTMRALAETSDELIDVKAELDRCLKILKDLPALRRYGDDIEAMKELAETITKVRDTL